MKKAERDSGGIREISLSELESWKKEEYILADIRDEIVYQHGFIPNAVSVPCRGMETEELEEAFRKKPKALILCNPSNPCGKVFTEEELKLIADLAIKYDVYVITDEVYEHIVYQPHRHIYLSSLPGMAGATASAVTSMDTTLRVKYLAAVPSSHTWLVPPTEAPRSSPLMALAMMALRCMT